MFIDEYQSQTVTLDWTTDEDITATRVINKLAQDFPQYTAKRNSERHWVISFVCTNEQAPAIIKYLKALEAPAV